MREIRVGMPGMGRRQGAWGEGARARGGEGGASAASGFVHEGDEFDI